MAFWVWLILLLAEDSHLNTGLWSIGGGKQNSFILDLKVPHSLLCPPCLRLLPVSPHTSRNSTNSRCPLGNPENPVVTTTLYPPGIAFLIWILSTAFFLTPNERESDGEEREGGGSMGWKVVRAEAQELFGYLQTTLRKERRKSSWRVGEVAWFTVLVLVGSTKTLFSIVTLHVSPCKECSCTVLTCIATSDSWKHSYRVKH